MGAGCRCRERFSPARSPDPGRLPPLPFPVSIAKLTVQEGMCAHLLAWTVLFLIYLAFILESFVSLCSRHGMFYRHNGFPQRSHTPFLKSLCLPAPLFALESREFLDSRFIPLLQFNIGLFVPLNFKSKGECSPCPVLSAVEEQ